MDAGLTFLFVIYEEIITMNYSQSALEALENGDLEQFDEQFNQALTNDSPELLFSLAEELYSLGFSNYSVQIYQQLLQDFPDEDSIKINLAEIMIDNDEDDQALNYLSEVSPDSDEYLQSLMVAADLYQSQGLVEISEQKLIQAFNLAPEEPVIEFALAEFYFAMANYRKAINFYLDLIKKGQLEISAVNLVERLGFSYAEIGKFEQAIGYLQQVKTASMSPNVKFELAFTYFSLANYELAIKTFEDLKETDAHYTSLYPYLADAYRQVNQIDQALITIQEGLAVDQYNEKIWLKAAQIAELANEDQLAKEYLVKGHEVAPEDIEVLNELSDWYLNHEDYSANIELLTSFNDEELIDAHLQLNLAISYHQLGELEKARSYYENVEAEFNDNADYLKQLALFYRQLGDANKQKSALQRYLQLNPADFEMQAMYEDDFEF